MAEVTLEALARALRLSWSVESCDPTDVTTWTPDNPTRGQCAATALVIRDFLGGALLEAEVLLRSGERQGFHYWNRLAGRDLDLTLEQFSADEIVQAPHLVVGPPESPWLAEAQYRILRERVVQALRDADPTLVIEGEAGG